VRRSDYLDIGGYDERYKGSSVAHTDFACRWLNEFGRPHRASCDVFHRWRRMDFWPCEALEDIQARKFFAEREKAGFPPLDRDSYWGKFSSQVSS
jgi:hypothetical protein